MYNFLLLASLTSDGSVAPPPNLSIFSLSRNLPWEFWPMGLTSFSPFFTHIFGSFTSNENPARGCSVQCKSYLQGVSKKRYFLDFLSYFSSIGRILLFHMCFGIRISSPFHLAIQKVSIQNLNCPKNACADMIFIPALRSEDWAGIKIMSAHAFLAFLGQLRFWMDTFWIAWIVLTLLWMSN